MKKYIWMTLGAILVFVALTLAASLFLNREDDNLRAKERALHLRPAQDPERGETEEVIVPADRVPSDFSERMRAAAITLLPNHLQAPEARSDATLPEDLQKEIESIVSGFLKSWETYTPGSEKVWQRTWRQFVLEDSIPEIAARRDSTDAPGVCPTRVCEVGSRWFGDRAIVFPVDYDAEHIYLVAYGSLLYRGDPRLNSYAGGSTERSYGILLAPTQSGWRIARVAAESLR